MIRAISTKDGSLPLNQVARMQLTPHTALRKRWYLCVLCWNDLRQVAYEKNRRVFGELEIGSHFFHIRIFNGCYNLPCASFASLPLPVIPYDDGDPTAIVPLEVNYRKTC